MIRKTTTFCIVGTALAAAAGCSATGTPSNLAQTPTREAHREYLRECLFRNVDQTFEMSQIDPTYIMRYCRKEAYQRLSSATRSPGAPR
ncbi:MAG: hypothetical protein P8Y69_11975 [Gammaproteobacteria bacterium]